MKFQFPHFSHRIPSRLLFSLEMLLLWLGLVALFVINVFSLQRSRPAYWNKLMMLFEAPFSVPRHIDLASLLWQQGNKEEARRLMAAAPSGNVLGATTDTRAILSEWENEQRRLNEQYAFWQSVASARPDYRDAYIQLVSLAYQLGNLTDARAWLTKAQSLDPNSPTVQSLTKFLE